MNDLNVINKQNAKAVEAHASKEAAAGKYVHLKYTGLHFVDYEAFDTEADRNAAAAAYTAKGGSNVSKFLNPTK